MRLYNGAPDSELQAVWDRQDKARQDLNQCCKKLFSKEDRARITWFPMECKYHACAWIDDRYHELTGFHDDIVSCSLAGQAELERIKNG